MEWLVERLVDSRGPRADRALPVGAAADVGPSSWLGRGGDDMDTLRDHPVLRLAVSDRRGVSPWRCGRAMGAWCYSGRVDHTFRAKANARSSLEAPHVVSRTTARPRAGRTRSGGLELCPHHFWLITNWAREQVGAEDLLEP